MNYYSDAGAQEYNAGTEEYNAGTEEKMWAQKKKYRHGKN